MCVTATVALIALTVATVGFTALSISQQNKAAKGQAKFLESQALKQQAAQRIRSRDFKDVIRGIVATQESKFAANGITSAFGTPLRVLERTVTELTRDDFTDQFNTNERANTLRQNASNLRAEAKANTLAGIASIGTTVASTVGALSAPTGGADTGGDKAG